MCETVAEHISSRAKEETDGFSEALENHDLMAKMIEKDTVIQASMIINLNTMEEVHIIGVDLDTVMGLCLNELAKANGAHAWIIPEENSQSLLGELIATAKNSVTLTINEFKSKCWDQEKQEWSTSLTAAEYIRDEKEMQAMGMGSFEASAEEEAAMLELNQIIELQVYPITQVGFISGSYGDDLPGVLAHFIQSTKDY
jgi:hypothetical protein